MALEILELACGCCELCLGVAEAVSSGSDKKRETENRADDDAAGERRREATAARNRREHKRGVRLEFAKRHIVDVIFLEGANRGRRASEMDDMELKRLALSMKHRTARFALRRFLRNRKAGRAPPAPSDGPVVRR